LKQVVLYFIILITVPFYSSAQSPNEIKVLDDSLFFSAVVPGLGQIYNKQYWKLPILYGGGILVGHLIKYNSDNYNAFRNAYIAETDGDDTTENPFSGFGEAALERRTEQFERDRNFIIIIGAVLYLLNVVDAHVASHLIEFEINEDLSFKPSFHANTEYTVQNIGMSFVFQLSK